MGLLVRTTESPGRSTRTAGNLGPRPDRAAFPSPVEQPPVQPMTAHPISSVDSTSLGERLLLVWERTGDDLVRQLAEAEGAETGVDADSPLRELPESERADWVSTAVMNAYKDSGDTEAFALLFERNQVSFLQAIRAQVRRSGSTVDPHDVLQEVFLNIYRYPHRFVAEKADSFRNWGHRIVRNTLLKFLKGQNRIARFASLDDEPGDREDPRLRPPDRCAVEAESAGLVNWAYLVYLNLYLIHFDRLSARERRALTLVEIDGASYKEAAADLGIRLENLKMVIFRGRRKIQRGMQRTLDDLSAVHATPTSTLS